MYSALEIDGSVVRMQEMVRESQKQLPPILALRYGCGLFHSHTHRRAYCFSGRWSNGSQADTIVCIPATCGKCNDLDERPCMYVCICVVCMYDLDCLYVCVFVCMYACMYVCVVNMYVCFMYVCLYVYVFCNAMYVCTCGMFLGLWVCMYVLYCVGVYMYVYGGMCMHVWIYVFYEYACMCMYVCVCVCM